MKQKRILNQTLAAIFIILLAANAKTEAQQIIEFEALSEPFHILTQEDVNIILDGEWEGGEFIALISDDVTEIEFAVFSGYDGYGPTINEEYLIEVYGQNVKIVGESAFVAALNLIFASFPSAEIIDAFAFYRSGLAEANFLNVKIIGENAFWDCANLTSANFLLAEVIGENAFMFCENLISIKFPLVNIIKQHAFWACINLISIKFPLVITIDTGAFIFCYNLTSIKFPLVTTIELAAFVNCDKITLAVLGTNFDTETEIKFGVDVFRKSAYGGKGVHLTPDIELILGEYVLPKPNLTMKTWQDDDGDGTGKDYVWKSITIYNGIEEHKEEKIDIHNLENNVYYIHGEDILEITLYDIKGRLVGIYENDCIINLDDLAKGFYMFRIKTANNKNYVTKKIIIN